MPQGQRLIRFPHSSFVFGTTDAGGIAPVIARYTAFCISDAPEPAWGPS